MNWFRKKYRRSSMMGICKSGILSRATLFLSTTRVIAPVFHTSAGDSSHVSQNRSLQGGLIQPASTVLGDVSRCRLILS